MSSVASSSDRLLARVSISARREAASSFRFSACPLASRRSFSAAAMPCVSASAARNPTATSACLVVSRAWPPPGSLRTRRSEQASAASPTGVLAARCAPQTPTSTARRPTDTAVLAILTSADTTAPATLAAAPAARSPTPPARSASEPPGNQRMALFSSSTGSSALSLAASAASAASCVRPPSAAPCRGPSWHCRRRGRRRGL
mmetsp:Transcript_66301/g.179210  ORF Transcript_66301/g.179210 Transcript_66301/m.179210 type:complete len:203 (-) Transcript_66301:1455-2063(-)